MRGLQVKTRKEGGSPQYKENQNNVVTFLKHSEDRIEAKNGEVVNIDVYENGSLIFSDDKYEFFEKLKA